MKKTAKVGEIIMNENIIVVFTLWWVWHDSQWKLYQVNMEEVLSLYQQHRSRSENWEDSDWNLIRKQEKTGETSL